jgi:transcriptional regulator with GAF, ATPase, and Fis domain
MQAQQSIHSVASRNVANIEDVRVASLKVLALTLLHQIESLEEQLASGATPELNLHTQVHHFEAALIRNALVKTGGRQRRAARLLGVKVTTLNTKIKRHNINLQPTT